MSGLDLEAAGAPTLLSEGQAPPPASGSPLNAPVEQQPATAAFGGWTEERTQRAITYVWQEYVAPGMEYGLGAVPAEYQLKRLELDVLTIVVQAFLNRRVPLIGETLNPEHVDKILVAVLSIMLLSRALRIYMRRGRIGPLSAEEKAEREQPRPAAQQSRPQPMARPAEAAPTPAPAASNGHKSDHAWSFAHLGGPIGDGRTLASN